MLWICSKRMRFLLLHEIQEWAWNSEWVDRIPDGADEQREYRRTNLYSNHPLIFDLSVDRVVLDAFCPWAKEFTFTQDDTVQLRRSVTDEESENRNRAARGSRRGPSGQA